MTTNNGTGREVTVRQEAGQLANYDEHIGQLMEAAVLKGDLAQFTPRQKVDYVVEWCKSLGLNPLSRPFDILKDKSGKEVIYLNVSGAAQLRGNRGVSCKVTKAGIEGDLYVVRVQATTRDGRYDEDMGAIPIVKEGGEWTESASGKRYFKRNGQKETLTGEALATAMKHAESSAKRRVTLSILGLTNIIDPETGAMRSAPTVVDTETGEIIDGQATEPDDTPFAEPPISGAEPMGEEPPGDSAAPVCVECGRPVKSAMLPDPETGKVRRYTDSQVVDLSMAVCERVLCDTHYLRATKAKVG